MESLKTWFQDWSDACEYARECFPDLSFFAPQEPYSAFVAIVLVCFMAWRINESLLRRALAAERRASLSALSTYAACGVDAKTETRQPLRQTLAA